jgi:SAM-dependent MidA family methyltransferase
MNEISQLLRQEIATHGAISFARFMEIALYCPKIGYYERDSGLIGLAGQFYTSPSLGPLFGQLLATQFAFWSLERRFEDLRWVEGGAHDGTMALAILEWLGKNRPALLERLTYVIVEPSVTRRGWQEQKLAGFTGRVKWVESLAELKRPGVTGVIFSNELIDSFPIQRICWDRSRLQWHERGVALRDNDFVWVRLQRSNVEIQAELKRAGIFISPELLTVLPDGFTIDLSPGATDWWKGAAEALTAGKLMTIDYGYTGEELLAPERSQGTARAYFAQRASDDLLANPGEQDLTAHINFSQLQRVGEGAGLKTEMLVEQERFLSLIFQRDLEYGNTDRWSAAELRQFHSLTHPEHLGKRFRVLVQSR